MGRPSISEQRRIEIGRALQTCVVRNGSYESTSVKDIAQEAGIATGLIHHYFTNKDEILLLMADASLLSVFNLLEDLLHTRQDTPRREKLHELLSDENQSRFVLTLSHLSLSMPEIRDLILARREELRESLTARLRRSQAFSGNPEETAYRLVFLLESAVAQAALESSPLLEELLLQALQEAFPAREA